MWELRSDPWVRKIPRRRKWQPTPILLPGEFHGERNLIGYGPWGHKESDTSNTFTFILLRWNFSFSSSAISGSLDSRCSCSVTQPCLTLGPHELKPTRLPCPSLISLNLLKFMSIELVMLSNHLILCHSLSLPALNVSQHQSLFQWVSSPHQVANVLELQLHHQSFQWIFRVWMFAVCLVLC